MFENCNEYYEIYLSVWRLVLLRSCYWNWIFKKHSWSSWRQYYKVIVPSCSPSRKHQPSGQRTQTLYSICKDSCVRATRPTSNSICFLWRRKCSFDLSRSAPLCPIWTRVWHFSTSAPIRYHLHPPPNYRKTCLVLTFTMFSE